MTPEAPQPENLEKRRAPVDVTDIMTDAAKAQIMARQAEQSRMAEAAAADSAARAAEARSAIESAAPTQPIIDSVPENIMPTVGDTNETTSA